MRDTITDVLPVAMLGPAALDADNTPVAFSLTGYAAASIDIAVGVGGITFTGTNKIEFKLTYSTDGGTTYTAVGDDDVRILLPGGTLGSVGPDGIVRSLTAAHAAASITQVQLKKAAEHWKILADFGGTHASETPICVTLNKHAAYVGR